MFKEKQTNDLFYITLMWSVATNLKIAQWASYVVGAITHLKVKNLLDFAKSQIARENWQSLCLRPLVLIFIGTKINTY